MSQLCISEREVGQGAARDGSTLWVSNTDGPLLNEPESGGVTSLCILNATVHCRIGGSFQDPFFFFSFRAGQGGHTPNKGNKQVISAASSRLPCMMLAQPLGSP